MFLLNEYKYINSRSELWNVCSNLVMEKSYCPISLFDCRSGREPPVSVGKETDELQNWSEHGGEEKILCPSQERNPGFLTLSHFTD